jgi:hypothetical protein
MLSSIFGLKNELLKYYVRGGSLGLEGKHSRYVYFDWKSV